MVQLIRQPGPAGRAVMLVVAALFLLSFIAAPASAGAPPRELRVGNALPGLSSYSDEVTITDPAISSEFPFYARPDGSGTSSRGLL